MKTFYWNYFLDATYKLEIIIYMIGMPVTHFLIVLLVVNYLFITDNPYLKRFKLLMAISKKLNLYLEALVIWNYTWLALLAVGYVLRYILLLFK